MYVAEGSQSGLKGINAYNNFGLRTNFVSVYLAEREAFDQTAQLNRAKQVPAAKAWFRQGLLMDAKTTAPTKLLDVFEEKGRGGSIGMGLRLDGIVQLCAGGEMAGLYTENGCVLYGCRSV